MGRDKFIYNTQTLRYEKHTVPIRYKILKGFSIACALLFSAFALTFVINPLFPSNVEKEQARKINQLSATIEGMNTDLSKMEKVLDHLQERDASVHRMMFGMEPIDEAIWNGGIGGHDPYAQMPHNLSNDKALLNTKERINNLKRKLSIQSQSLDVISKHASNKEDMLACIPSITPVRSDKLARSVRLLSGFGMRLHPIHKVRKMHAGIDFTAPTGTPIYVTGNGVVKRVERKRTGYGYNVVVDHGYGYETLYAHMSKIKVRQGDQVKKGQEIGHVGSTGTSTAPHCHYEVHLNGKAINPIHYCMDDLSVEEYQILVDKTAIANQSFD